MKLEISTKNPMKPTLPLPPAPATVISNISHKLLDNIPGIISKLPQPPFFMQKKVAEKVLQKLMAEQIEMGDFDFLQQRWLHINIEDMGLNFFLGFENEQLILSNQIKQADVTFRGRSREFLLLASRLEDPDTLFFQRRLVIEGDTELGLYIKNSIDGIDFDNWPQWLNQLIKKIALISNSTQDEHVPSFSPPKPA